MRYTVVWSPTAEADLAAIWEGIPDQNAVEAAANKIDSLLLKNPGMKGESRESMDRRILFELPLAVVYRVHEADRLVRVSSVWYVIPHGPRS